MKQVASLQYGVIFKKGFSDVEVFKGFVRDILGIALEIDKVETEKEFKPVIGHVNVKFDLYAEDSKNNIVVEIQHEKNKDHYDRFLHYHCVALLDQAKNSTKYRPEKTVYTIVVLTDGDHELQYDVATIEFDPKQLNGKPLNKIKHRVIYLCPKYINEQTPVLYQEWLRVINASLTHQVDESQYHTREIQKVLLRIEESGVTPEEREKIIEESYAQEAEQRGLERGFEIGIEQGIEQGIAQGVEQGITRGVEQGKLLEKQEMAKALLKKGFDKQTIVELTGLKLEEIL